MRRKQIYWGLLAAFLICLTYSNSFQNGFHFDDYHTVVDNPAIRSLKNIPRFFSDASTFSVLPANRTYRPLVSTSLAIDYALGDGYHPLWFHLIPFAIYLLQLFAMLLFFLAIYKQFLGDIESYFIALAAVSWYGVHPAMAETVNYIIQRGDIFSTFGVVAALALYVQLPHLRRWGIYLIPFLFGLFSKPPAIVFPVLLFAYIFYFKGEGDNRWKVAAKGAIPSAILGAALMWFQSAMTPKTFAPSTLSNADYLLTQPFVLLRYFGSFFLPLHLNADTDLQAFHRVNASSLYGILFLVVLLATIFFTGRRERLRPVSYGLLWFLVASVPTSLYRLSEVENDHRMYMPFVGLALSVSWVIALSLQFLFLRGRVWRQVTVAAVCLILVMYAHGAYLRNQVWHTEESLWLDCVQKSPKNGRGLMNYGLTQMSKGNYAVALDYFQRALLYTPNYPVLEINLGVVNGAMNRPQEAEQHFLRAIMLAPSDDSTHYYYGRWLYLSGRISEALSQLGTSVQLNPDRLEAKTLLLQAARHAGDPQAADTPEALLNKSLALNQAGKYQESIDAARSALKLRPDYAEAWNNIAAGYESMGQWDQAIAAAENAIRLKPDFQLAKNNLAWSNAQKAKQSSH